jgi:hypothetical protein
MEASNKGYSNIKLFSAKKYDKYNNLPVIFLLLGSKDEGKEIFKKLKIVSLEERLATYFKDTNFTITIAPISTNRVGVTLRWK